MASRTAYSTGTPQEPTLFDGHYLRNLSTLDIGVLGYIGKVQHKEHSPEVLSIPPGTPCIGWSRHTAMIQHSTIILYYKASKDELSWHVIITGGNNYLVRRFKIIF